MTFRFSLPAVAECTWRDSVQGTPNGGPTVPPAAAIPVVREEGLLGVSCVTLSVLPSPHVGISPSGFAPLCRLNGLGSPSAIDSESPKFFVAKHGGISAHENSSSFEKQQQQREKEGTTTAIPVDDAVKTAFQQRFQSRVSSTRLCCTSGGSLGGRGGGCVHDDNNNMASPAGCKWPQFPRRNSCSAQSPIPDPHLHTSSETEFVPLLSSSNLGSMDADSFEHEVVV